MLLSIIIPIFKVEDYIYSCFDSIYSQSLDESIFEVIAVNDGTTDNSMSIVDNFAVKHGNLKVVNQPNSGVSVARNNGMKHAKGKFVIFVDPDDFLFDGALSRLCDILVSSDNDMIIMRSLKKEKEVFPWLTYFKGGEVTDGINMYLKGYSRGSVWGVAYQKKFIEKYAILFPVGIRNGEDSAFFGVCQLNAQSILLYDLIFYSVFERPGSATTSLSINAIDLFSRTAQNIYTLIKQNEGNYSNAQLSLLSNMLYRCISQWVYSTVSVKDASLNYLIETLNIKQYLPIMLNYTQGYSFSSKMALILQNKSFALYYGIIKIKSILKGASLYKTMVNMGVQK